MIFQLSDGQRELIAQQQWHTWFAWYPVRLDHLHMVWLQRVERRLCANDDWHYRVIP